MRILISFLITLTAVSFSNAQERLERFTHEFLISEPNASEIARAGSGNQSARAALEALKVIDCGARERSSSQPLAFSEL